MQTFGEIATLASGSRPKGGVGGLKDGVLSLGGEHIGKNGWLDLTSPKYVEHSYYAANPKGHVKDNDILLCKDGALSGKVAIVRDELNETQAMVNEHVFLIRSSVISPRCLYYYLFSQSGKTALKAKITGAAQGGINGANLKTIVVPVPPTKEQEKIVAELDCLSGIIEKKKQQLKELDNLAGSIFYDMFGDPITNERGWEMCLFKEGVVEMFLGPFGSSLKTDCYVDKAKSFCMVYEQKHAIRKTLEQDNHYIDEEKYNSLKRFEVLPGDLIMSCRGTIGEVFELPADAPIGIIHPSLMKLRLKDGIFNRIFFKTILDKIVKGEDTNGGCVQMAITAKVLGNKKVIFPPLVLQNAFAQKIEAIEKQKELIKKSIQETETLFNSRMDYWFN